jgi:PIN domain nuclease of toxin-antitoxin system
VKLLIDTHILLWCVADNSRLKPRIRDMITDRANEVLFSTVSIWEVLIKIRVGKMQLDWRRLEPAALAAGFARKDIEHDHLVALAALPRHHGDPFDHMLVAQASAEGAALVTTDRILGDYPIKVIVA